MGLFYHAPSAEPPTVTPGAGAGAGTGVGAGASAGALPLLALTPSPFSLSSIDTLINNYSPSRTNLTVDKEKTERKGRDRRGM
jgi:hypothetical protein